MSKNIWKEIRLKVKEFFDLYVRHCAESKTSTARIFDSFVASNEEYAGYKGMPIVTHFYISN